MTTEHKFSPEFRARMIEAYAAWALELPDQPLPKTAERKAKRRAKCAEFVQEAREVRGLIDDPQTRLACDLFISSLISFTGEAPTFDPCKKSDLAFLRRITVMDDLRECRRIIQRWQSRAARRYVSRAWLKERRVTDGALDKAVERDEIPRVGKRGSYAYSHLHCVLKWRWLGSEN